MNSRIGYEVNSAIKKMVIYKGYFETNQWWFLWIGINTDFPSIMETKEILEKLNTYCSGIKEFDEIKSAFELAWFEFTEIKDQLDRKIWNMMYDQQCKSEADK